MKLKKAKKLAKRQMIDMLNQAAEIVNSFDDVYRNDQLEIKLKELKKTSNEFKKTSDELIAYFLDNCHTQSEKIKDMNERNCNYKGMANFEDKTNDAE